MALSLKEGLVECATVCVKSEVILKLILTSYFLRSFCSTELNRMNQKLKKVTFIFDFLRFGKRSGNVFGRTIESEENKMGLTPMGNDISEIRKRLLSL